MKMSKTIQHTETETLVVVTCWCGIRHAVPQSLRRVQLQQPGKKEVFCPLGHAYVSGGESEADRIKQQLLDERKRHESTRKMLDATRWDRDHAQRSAAAFKGHATRKGKQLERVKAGVCPCCNRHFKNLERHMTGQHPDFNPSGDDHA